MPLLSRKPPPPPAFESVGGRERRGEKGEEGVGGFSQPTNYFFAYSKEMLYHSYTPHRGGFRPNNRMTDYDIHIRANTCLCIGLFRDVFHLAGQDFATPFGEDGIPYSNYVVFKQTLRMRLLALRDLKPHLFTGERVEPCVQGFIIFYDHEIL